MSTIIEEFMEEIGRQVTCGSNDENYTVNMEEFDRQAAQVTLSVYDEDGANDTDDTDGSMEEELALENIVEPIMVDESIEWDW